jgi:hypothetical protein
MPVMTTGSRRSIGIVTLLALLAVTLAVSLAACGSAATPKPSSTAVPDPTASAGSSPAPSASPAPSPSVEASPMPPSPSPSIGQTDTEWGRIWDAVPPSFPTHPDSTTTEVGHASSDQRVVTGTIDAVTTWYQGALESAGYSTEALSGPFEDGSMVIDSVGEPLECRVQVRIGPLGELVVIDILYGSDCPSS